MYTYHMDMSKTCAPRGHQPATAAAMATAWAAWAPGGRICCRAEDGAPGAPGAPGVGAEEMATDVYGLWIYTNYDYWMLLLFYMLYQLITQCILCTNYLFGNGLYPLSVISMGP